MRHSYLLLILFFSVFLSAGSYAFKYEVIRPKAVKKKIQGPCSLIHFWASWCEICIKEMPTLLPFLESRKKVESTVIDLSHSLAQEKFSKVWLKKTAPLSTTFRKGKGQDHDLVDAVLPKWSGGLPLTILFVKGKRVEVWNGSVAPTDLEAAFKKHCPN